MNQLAFVKRRKFPSPLQSVDSSVGPVKPDDSDITSGDLDNIQDTSRLYDKENENPDVEKMRGITPPKLDDYLPGTGRRIANALVAGATAFSTKNPLAGIKVGDELNRSGLERAKEQFTQDLGAASTTAKASQASGALAEKDFSQQQDTETTNANLEEKKAQFAQEFGLSQDKLNALIENEKAERAQGDQRLANDRTRTGIEATNAGTSQGHLAETVRHNQAIETLAGEKTTNKPLPAMMQNKVAAADDVVMTANRMKEMLNDPEVIKHIGPIIGRANDLEELMGSQDPIARKFGLAGRMMADTHANLFGARNSIGAMQHFETGLGFKGLKMNREMALATLDAVIQKAQDTKQSIYGVAGQGHGGNGVTSVPGDKGNTITTKSGKVITVEP